MIQFSQASDVELDGAWMGGIVYGNFNFFKLIFKAIVSKNSRSFKFNCNSTLGHSL